MLHNLRFVVPPDQAGLRADRFLIQNIATTDRALVKMAFEQNAVRVNGRATPKGLTLQTGDTIEVTALFEKSDRRVIPEPQAPLNVIYEDNALLVLDKPSDMPVHPLRIGELGTLANAMVARFPETASIGPDPMFPALVHRIDSGTSGLVVAARTNAAYAFLRRQFQMHRVRKEYLALVHGTPPKEGRIVHYLAHDTKHPGHMVASETLPVKDTRRWMKAITNYRLERSWGEYSLLRVIIHTGVTHQIRCQLATVGFPIVGDPTYGNAAARIPPEVDRLCLHAAAIAFVHPDTKKSVRFECPLPADWPSAFGTSASVK